MARVQPINLPPVGHAEGPLAGLSLTEILDQVDAGQLSLAKLIGQYSDRTPFTTRDRRQTFPGNLPHVPPVASAVFNFGLAVPCKVRVLRSDLPQRSA